MVQPFRKIGQKYYSVVQGGMQSPGGSRGEKEKGNEREY